ncbi:uncharacterized protein LOC118756086 [Rhagoletis pomonella]|uniref:uncharacterized protein LOC118756086 n=1 Tax=Rhagoletis pomonella TaxID=28610 RepID=UPI001783F2AD|nr:uncharacterized protein LOC118756086 [Rhagoletis pomonella]
MEATKKAYNYILVVVDAFSKFVWLYPTKSTGAEAVLDRLRKQAAIFGNPARIVTDRGSAFTSHPFKEYCAEEGIQHLLIATGVPRGNGQVERMHKIVVPMISKLCQEKPSQWYRHVKRVQQYINSTPPRSTKFAPFRIQTGMEMRIPNMPDLQQLLARVAVEELDEDREAVRKAAQENIARIQSENRKTFNSKRKQEEQYEVGELVAIKRTQFGSGLRLQPKFLGPYQVTEKLNHCRYEVQNVDDHEGPAYTTTVAEYLK